MRKRTNDRNSKFTSSGSKVQSADVVLSNVKPPISRCWWWLKWGLLGLCVVYIAVPFMFRFSPDFLNHILYSHRVRFPFLTDLSKPSELSLNHTVNMYLSPEEGVSLGIWHTVPESQWKEAQGKDLAWYQNSLGGGSPIVIYLHGNGGTRAASHRVGVANVLSEQGFHVLVLDYRGFGDSSGNPTEAGLTTDALHLYQWVKARSGSSLVLIWGQSLGTGVATNTVVKLLEHGVVVDGVILEGSFTNIRQEVAHHPFAWYYWRFPGFDYFFLDTMKENHNIFPNDENMKKIKSHVLILHAEDDHIVPIHQAEELYHIAQGTQNLKNRVKMVPFSGSHGYKHNGLYKDPHLPEILRQFVLSLAQ